MYYIQNCIFFTLGKFMKFKNILLLVTSLLFTSYSHAEASKTNLDIMGSIGISVYSDFPVYNSLNDTTNLRLAGFNISLSGLYSLFETKLGYPVLGGGISHISTSNSSYYSSQSTPSGNLANTKNTSFSSDFLDLNGGFKFRLSTDFSLFTLANLGYSISDTATSSESSYYVLSSSVNINNQLTVKNHYKYGASLIIAYDLIDNLGIGLGGTFNRHQMTVSGNTTTSYGSTSNTTSIPTTSASFDEISVNFILSYSI
jgi:hypothetical protein